MKKILSYRDVFHFVLLSAEIDRLVEEKPLRPFNPRYSSRRLRFIRVIDETLGLDLSGLYGTIGQTNFGDIDVNKVGVVSRN